MKKFILDIPGLKEFYIYFKETVIYFFEKKKWNALKNKEKIKLELGSEKKGENGFTTIDYMNGDIRHNLLKAIPLENSIVDEIYSSHTLEHFSFNDIIFIIHECRRILKPGGKLKICVPNAKLYIESYINNKNFSEKKNWYKPAITDTGSYIDQLNYVAYLNGQHKFLFDNQNLVNILKMCGFKNANLRDFEKEVDRQDRDYESIYALAIK